jgi:hypothetical protein
MGTMIKLDLGAMLRDTFALAQRDAPLSLSVAALFYFLPSSIFYGMVAGAGQVPQGGDIAALWRFVFDALLIPSLIVGTFGAIGSVMIIRLWFQPVGTTVGEAVRYAVALAPVTISLHLAISCAIIGGMFLLLVPGIIVAIRMVPAFALLADRPMVSPVDAWRDCWALTAGNGVPILLAMMIIGLLSLSLALLLGLFDPAVKAGISPMMQLLGGIVDGVIALVSGLLNTALSAAIYRQLRLPDMRGIFS